MWVWRNTCGSDSEFRMLIVDMVHRIVLCCVLAAASVAEAAPKMVKGPYLQDLAPSSITVMWQMDELVPAKLVVEGPGGTKTQDVQPARICEARVDGLQPA